MNKQRIWSVAALATAMFLPIASGCASVRSNVTAFHHLPVDGTGKTFLMVPYESQQGSIEYQTYADRIAAKLHDYGLSTHTSTNEAPDYVVFIDYGLHGSSTVSGSTPIYGQTGGGSSSTHGTISGAYGSSNFNAYTYSQPTYGQVGSIPYTRRIHDRHLSLIIINAKKSAKDNIITAYEGRVLSSGSSEEISVVLPSMIEALFRDFPGQSGKTRRITTGLER